MSDLLVDAGGETPCVDHGAPLGACADFHACVIVGNDCVADFSAFNLNHLGVHSNVLADARRRQMAHIDVNADGLLVVVEKGLGELGAGALHQANHRWGRKDIGSELARPHVDGGLIGGASGEARAQAILHGANIGEAVGFRQQVKVKIGT